jgi:antitoxin component YwqK of YwqJK toxin-antitoxin module
MKRFCIISKVRIFVVAVAAAAACVGESARAQEDGKASVKIQPYTGPPIFLDEPEQIAAPKIVERQKIQDKYEDTGKVRIEREVARFSDNHLEADGMYREYYPDGQLFVEGQFRRGRQQGEWTYYFENGKVNRKAVFADGKPDGTREIYRDDGTLAAKRSFRDGQREGEWIIYDKSGTKPLREEYYANGEPDGVWKVWHPNGELKQQISLKQGQRHGTSTEWAENGEKRAEVNYVDGKLHGTFTRFLPDGRKIVQQYEEGKLQSQSSG